MTERAATDEEELGGTHSPMGRLEIMEDPPPPLSYYMETWRFWWKFWLWPSALILLNIVLYSSLVIMDIHAYENRYQVHDNNHRQIRQAMFQTNKLVIAGILFFDAVVLYRGAIFVEQELSVSAGEEEESPNARYVHVHAQVSRKLDRYLGRGIRPRVSALVSLIYLAAVVCLAKGVEAFAYWTYAHTPVLESVCWGNHPPGKVEHIDGLPEGLQQWAGKFKKLASSYGGRPLQANYIHMVDGSTFFAGRSSSPASEEEEYHIYGYVDRMSLVSTRSDGTIKTYERVNQPYLFTNIKGDSEQASETFCCLFYDSDQLLARYSGHSYRAVGPKTLCITSSEEESNSSFRNTTLFQLAKNTHIDAQSTTSYNGELWYGITTSRYMHSHLGPEGTERITQFYRLDPITMKHSSVRNITESVQNGIVTHSGCDIRLKWIGSLAATFVLLPAGAALLKMKKMPVGAAPICVAALVILTAISKKLAVGIGALATLGATVSLFGFASGWELLVWVMYSILAFLSTMAFLIPGDNPIPMMLFGLFVGLLLNHPVLQISGWVGGVLSIVRGIFYMIKSSLSYDYVRHNIPDITFMIVVGVIGGCGSVAAGNVIARYRAYFRFYLNQIWRVVHQAPGSTETMRHGDNGGIMTRLLTEERGD